MGVHADTGDVSFVAFVVVAVAGPPALRRAVRLLRSVVVRLMARLPKRPAPPRPLGRPIEDIACDIRRLGLRYRYLPGLTTFTRFEGARRAYDQVLAEACRALDLEHLLGVLPPGADLDRERERVEAVLELAGVRLDTVP